MSDAAVRVESPPSQSTSHHLSPYAEFGLRVAERFGVPTLLLLVVGYWLKADIVQPLLDAHFEVVEQIVDGQKRHTERLELIGAKLDTLIRVQSDAPEQAPPTE